MRILFHVYVPDALHAAGNLQSVRVCHALATCGAEVTLHVSTNAVSSRRELLEFLGVPDVERLHVVIHRQRGKLRGSARLVRLHGSLFHLGRLARLLATDEKRRYDVFLARGYRFPALHVIARPLLGYRVVYEIHELNAFHDAVEGDLFAAGPPIDLERHAFRRADGIISVSRSLLDIAVRKWGAPRASVVVPSGGIRAGRVSPAPERPLRHVYYVGNLYPLSGVEHVVEAMRELPEATLTIVGSKGPGTDSHDRLVARIRAAGVEDRVHVRGFVRPAEIPEVYREADVLVAPYARTLRTERFCSPLKIFEYMHARRPIVASDFPTIREVLTDGESALLVKPEDPGAIRDALRRLMTDPALGRRLADRAYADAEAYTLERRAAGVLAFLDSIVHAGVREGVA